MSGLFHQALVALQSESSPRKLVGAPRILSELQLLRYTVSETTVAKYMPKTREPSQTWRTFLANHVPDIVAIDSFTVPTLMFGVLYGFVVLRHEQRQVVHFNVPWHPTAQWTAQQIVEAFPFDDAPRYLLRDRDHIYGEYFQQRVKNMSIEEVLIAPQSPWQIHMWSASSAPYGASFSTESSCSTKPICDG